MKGQFSLKKTECQLVKVSESWQMDSLNLAACFEKVAWRRRSSITKKEKHLDPIFELWQVVMGRMTFNKTAILRKKYLKTLRKEYLKNCVKTLRKNYLKHLGKMTLKHLGKIP